MSWERLTKKLRYWVGSLPVWKTSGGLHGPAPSNPGADPGYEATLAGKNVIQATRHLALPSVTTV
jgi:hypothetical protein